jgi:hypothetical protein
VTSPTNGVVAVAVAANASGGAERLKSLHPLAAETALGTSASLDNGASSANGGAAYIEAAAFTGTSVTVIIEHSTDNTSWSTLATFTAVSAANVSQRVPIVGTINRYTRERRSAGTFTSITHSVGLNRA